MCGVIIIVNDAMNAGDSDYPVMYESLCIRSPRNSHVPIITFATFNRRHYMV
jgi:hypothetical protein